MVSDKSQVRANGPVNQLTRQPIKGDVVAVGGVVVVVVVVAVVVVVVVVWLF